MANCQRECRYQELETKYNEQVRQNQITIHIKDLETREKIKELSEKFALESEAERQRYELLQQQKVEAEMEFHERVKAEEVWHRLAGDLLHSSVSRAGSWPANCDQLPSCAPSWEEIVAQSQLGKNKG